MIMANIKQNKSIPPYLQNTVWGYIITYGVKK